MNFYRVENVCVTCVTCWYSSLKDARECWQMLQQNEMLISPMLFMLCCFVNQRVLSLSPLHS